MLTEEEVLETLGAKPPSKSEPKERSSEDEAAMFKIYAALKKGPSSSDLSSQLSHNLSTSSSNQSLQPHNPVVTSSGLPFNDPSIISTQKHASINKTNQSSQKIDISNRHIGISELAPNDSVKKINMLFGGNVPTSVYRQLSSRSDNGSRESSTASSPALKFNPKPNISSFPHSPQSSANIPDLHSSVYKSPPSRSPILPQQSHNSSQYHSVVPPFSNGPNIPQHTQLRQEFPPPVGRNIPVEQLFEALFANMHGYAQFIPNLVNNAMAPNTIPGMPNSTNMQQRGMMTLEEIERRSLGGR
ncbi:hypothetical protein RhiirA5_365646 [Rhizophagus irregularis]|nr:hypothetical protein GLOIN_2v1695564 [Rhizophagus irregularis DAOM 181602=DAOM 197198]PKC00541.1 hypothetical protein RhiirA5_365646 [Rhizophagus irregularis]PKC58374.1 hypothetical protein RhiirA1_427781 [Rhizophagus irregularis]PKY30996.1 hypothetical protein RhiirB3_419200 [Rhizophagus irregularis]POG62520.1 hypothetical protein GLOIN_2v1695564 [Rhizophagus irregularis DAOM 181602=DAOM 197198]|eukprot:XP_025169386.1 hypothetical protein GLOIN_2v1695564 [Rhizophagus irregularis DAOM 181602=DAOM 197198]